MSPRVLIIMGSDSDMSVMQESAAILRQFGIPYEITISSAHRNPERTVRLIKEAERKGIEVVVAGAGAAAHLAGMVASHTIIPVIGIPLDSSPLGGIDALFSTVQMPAGIPVATMAIGKAGAKNAAIFAVQILAIKDRSLQQKLKAYRKKLARGVEEKAKQILESVKGEAG